jgi:hypothetical protein
MRERVLMLKNKLNQELKIGLLTGSVSVEDFATKDALDLEAPEVKKRIEEGFQWKMKA